MADLAYNVVLRCGKLYIEEVEDGKSTLHGPFPPQTMIQNAIERVKRKRQSR
jgi:hypothetical protein